METYQLNLDTRDNAIFSFPLLIRNNIRIKMVAEIEMRGFSKMSPCCDG